MLRKFSLISFIGGVLLSIGSAAFAQSYTAATVFCHESGGTQQGFLNVQPQLDAVAGTSVAFAFYIYNWNGQAWVGQGWSETFVHQASRSYPPQRLSVPSGYHRVVARYWWETSQGWSVLVDVETISFSQMHYDSATTQTPMQTPKQKVPTAPDLPPEMLVSERCHTD